MAMAVSWCKERRGNCEGARWQLNWCGNELTEDCHRPKRRWEKSRSRCDELRQREKARALRTQTTAGRRTVKR